MENIRKSKTNNLSEGSIEQVCFSIFLNCANEVEDRILMGRLFQRRGAATEKARLPQELVEGVQKEAIWCWSGADGMGYTGGIYGLMRHDI